MDKDLKARIQENKVLTSQERKNIIRDLEKLEKIEQILDDYIGEAWEVLELIKKVLEQE